jgi:hypothetical protein
MIEEYTEGRMKVQGQEYRRDLKIIDTRVIPSFHLTC